jgi:hypothetical protein
VKDSGSAGSAVGGMRLISGVARGYLASAQDVTGRQTAQPNAFNSHFSSIFTKHGRIYRRFEGE